MDTDEVERALQQRSAGHDARLVVERLTSGGWQASFKRVDDGFVVLSAQAPAREDAIRQLYEDDKVKDRRGAARVLSVDGGGMRGLIPARLLVEMETRTGRRVQDLFDLMAGTSTGGIIVLALAMPGPRYTPKDLLRLYHEDRDLIFATSRRHQLTGAAGLLTEKYEVAGLERVLGDLFGATMLSEAAPDVLVTAYELERREPYLFHSTRARESPHDDFPLRIVARATSAAPTYFPPLHVDRHPNPLTLVDGGVFAGNPAMCAFTELRARYMAREITLVSLGTGVSSKPMRYAQAGHWGLAHWARPILDIALEGTSHMTDLHLRGLPLRGYHRLQTYFPPHHACHLDDTRAATVEILHGHADRLIAECDAELDAICAALTEA